MKVKGPGTPTVQVVPSTCAEPAALQASGIWASDKQRSTGPGSGFGSAAPPAPGAPPSFAIVPCSPPSGDAELPLLPPRPSLSTAAPPRSLTSTGEPAPAPPVPASPLVRCELVAPQASSAAQQATTSHGHSFRSTLIATNRAL